MTKNTKIDTLITKLLNKFAAEGSNLERTALPFIKEVEEVRQRAPFLEISDYLYFLAEMSTLILRLSDGSYVTFYGVDDWDEGMNILDFPIPEKDGFHLFMDSCNPEGEILLFAFNSLHLKRDSVWVAPNREPEPAHYRDTGYSFADVLELVSEEKIQDFYH